MAKVVCCFGLNNYGKPDCTTVIDEIIGLVQVPLKSTAGVLNAITLGAPFGPTQITALLTNTDKKARWYPFPRLYNVALPIADTVFDETSANEKFFVRKGIWSFTAEMRDKDAVPPMLKKLENSRCSQWGFYLITKSNQLVGEVSVDGTKLYPLTVNNSSFDPKMMFKDATAVNKIMIGFDFDRIVQQKNLYVITGEETGVDFTRLPQLVDVNIAASDISLTTVTLTISTSFLQGVNPDPDVLGLDAPGDYIIKNKTTGATVVPTDVEEVSDGVYELTFAAQVAADEMTASINVTTNLYEGSVDWTVTV